VAYATILHIPQNCTSVRCKIKPPRHEPRAALLDRRQQQEAKIIAMRLGKPPKGYTNWSLRLLAEYVVELGLVESISHETIRQTLKKTE